MQLDCCERCGLFAPVGATRCGACGGAVRSVGPRTLNDGAYVLEEELGRGGTGIVYRARDVGLRRSVAIKVIAPAFARSLGGIEAFRREAESLAAVRSPYIAEVHTFDVREASCFIVMEHVQGKDLSRMLDEHRARGAFVPLRRSLAILTQLADGLAAVHRAGIVHRDIKPSNVIIEEGTGRPVLVDFGLSLRAGAAPAVAAGLGTPAFMAPEPARAPGSAITARADVYAFACTAFELITGQRVFSGKDAGQIMRMHRDAPPPLPSAVRPELVAFDVPLARGLAKEPSERPASCAELVAELRAVAAALVGSDEEAEPRDAWAAATAGDDALRVLLVDDDADFRAFLSHATKAVFHGRKIDVVGVETGADAVAVARSRMPHLVLLDYDMPGLDGIATLTRLRELEGSSEARVIVISGSVDVEIAWRFAVLGVIDFLEKPVDLRKLLDTVTSALSVPPVPPRAGRSTSPT